MIQKRVSTKKWKRTLGRRSGAVGVFALVALLPALQTARAQQLFADNFSQDSSLNTGLWSTDTALINTIAASLSATLVAPLLSFSNVGMTMSGVSGNLQFTGIQSSVAFAPPFVLQADVTGTVAHGNAFIIDLETGNEDEGLSVAGNLNPYNAPYYGMNLSADDGETVLYSMPSVNVPYTISMAMDVGGQATVVLSDSTGSVLGSRSDINVGDGPFYVLLLQYEGYPYAAGPNGAVWQSVRVTQSSPSIAAVVSASAFGGFTSVAPGSWIEIYGSNLAIDSRSWTSADFNGVNAPTSLDGTSVTIGGQSAFVAYISPGQVNALAPSNVAPGVQQVTVKTAGGTSAPIDITVNALQPGLLARASFNISGTQYAVAQFVDGTYVLPTGAISGINSRPAQPGEIIVIYGVGFGPVMPNIPAGQIVQQSNTLATTFQLSIGGMPATAAYSGLAPGETGVYQFDITVPNVEASTAVPLTFTLDGIAGTQTLYIAVQN
jgi:uncharacterized protein (TIGR03437 family)